MASSIPPDRPHSAIPSSISFLRTSSSLRSSSSIASLPTLTNTSNLHATNPRYEDSRSLLQQAFVPHIAVHASEDTNQLAKDKGFADFRDLLRPYGERVHGRVTARDSQGLNNTFEDFGIRIMGMWDLLDDGSRPVNNNVRPDVPGQTGLPGGGCLEEIERLMELHIDHSEELIETTLAQNETPGSQDGPYNTFLRRLLSRMPVSAHEAFTHPIACIIAISSRNPSPIETLRRLYESGSAVPIPLFINRDYLRYYVLVHDEDRDDLSKSLALFDQMKKHFGLHCHLLRLRSAESVVSDDDAVPVPRCKWQSAAEELEEIRVKAHDEYQLSQKYVFESDATALRTLVREMVTQSILPFMERCVATWNDQVASRRRGLSGRFLSMSKRYFGSSSSSSSRSSTYDTVTQSYPPSTPEATMRKLADYSFMLRDYKLAYSTYDLLRTDYSNDKAWKYHAGAQEMTALSLLLLPNVKPPTSATLDPILDLACYSYLSRCSDPYSYLRCIVLAVELQLPSKLTSDSAAKWATKAFDTPTLGPVTSALITERVSECFFTKGGIRRRKAAMWKVLAAKKWVEIEKGGRAGELLKEVAEYYEGCGWEGLRVVVDGLRESVDPRAEEEEPEEETEEKMGVLAEKRRSVIPEGLIGLTGLTGGMGGLSLEEKPEGKEEGGFEES